MGTAVVAVIVTVTGVIAANFVRSPADVAAESREPSPSVLTAPVEHRVLIDTVVLRGKVTPQSSFEVTPGSTDGGVPIVTAVFTSAGAAVQPGKVLLQVSGRPFFAFAGSIPMYRDLRPGSSGADVAQLQVALRALGHPTETDRAGYFGPGTKLALSTFYESIGYPAPATGSGDDNAAVAAHRQVTLAERAVRDAKVAQAAAHHGTAPPPPDGTDHVAAAERAVADAEADLKAARDQLAALISSTGAMLPVSEAIFLPAMPGRVVRLDAQVGAAVKAPTIVLSSGALIVMGNLNPAQRDLVQIGLSTEIFSEALNIKAQAVLANIGSLTTADVGGQNYPLTIEPSSPLDPAMDGQDVRLTIESARTAGEVLIVPVAAIGAGADGQTSVTKLSATRSEQRVVVTVGASGDGYVEVRSTGGELALGDRVVVGR
jgi:peptidoglycan hydrolase-like protein with peptidoglycan-binding domain